MNKRTFKLINRPKYEIVSIATKLFAKKPGVPIGANKLKKFMLKRVTAIKVVQKIKPVAINVVKQKIPVKLKAQVNIPNRFNVSIKINKDVKIRQNLSNLILIKSLKIFS